MAPFHLWNNHLIATAFAANGYRLGCALADFDAVLTHLRAESFLTLRSNR